jgi:peroxiredoxin
MNAITTFLAVLTVTAIAETPGERKAQSDKPIVSFKLRDYRGAWHALDDYKDKKLVVVAFLGTECPLANRYTARLAELAKEFEPKGVAFLGLISNQQDSISKVAQLAKEQRVTFPLLKDVKNLVADQFAARRTPEVFVLDDKRIVRYHGRIDDQYGIGYARPKPTRRDLVIALDRGGRLLYRTGETLVFPNVCYVYQAHRSAFEQTLRQLPSRRFASTVRPHFVYRRIRLGGDHSGSNRGSADAALARQSQIWPLCQR